MLEQIVTFGLIESESVSTIENEISDVGLIISDYKAALRSIGNTVNRGLPKFDVRMTR